MTLPRSASAQTRPPLFVFTYSPGPSWEPGLPMTQQKLRPHADYIADLTRAGRILAAGGFVDAEGGMAIVRAADAAEAGRMLAADPAITAGVFTATLRQWFPSFGSADTLVP